MITKTCYFYNVGTTFDKDDLKTLKNVWNCNGNCCKSDLCNGLNCENYGIVFNEAEAMNYIYQYVKNGVANTYGYIKKVDITLPNEEWKSIYDYLLKNYNFNSLEDASNNGFINFDYGELLEDYSSYWEEPDKSFYKTNQSTIEKNTIHVLREIDLNKNTIDWINKYLYGTLEDFRIMEI